METRQLKRRRGNLKIHGHSDKSSIQTIVLSLIQYKAHSVSPFICTNRAGGNRKHLIKSKLIFQQFELAELCYDGTCQRRMESNRRKTAFPFLPVSGCCLMYLRAVSHQSLLICSLLNTHIKHKRLIWMFHLLKCHKIFWRDPTNQPTTPTAKCWWSIYIYKSVCYCQTTTFTERCTEELFAFILVITNVTHVWGPHTSLDIREALQTSVKLSTCHWRTNSSSENHFSARENNIPRNWFSSFLISLDLIKVILNPMLLKRKGMISENCIFSNDLGTFEEKRQEGPSGPFGEHCSRDQLINFKLIKGRK